MASRFELLRLTKDWSWRKERAIEMVSDKQIASRNEQMNVLSMIALCNSRIEI